MGYYGKYDERLLAQNLRKQGLSYNEIQRRVSVSKDTLSRWCRDIPLTEEQKKRLLKNKNDGQRKGSLVAAERKRRLRERITKNIYLRSRRQLGTISERDKFLTGIALYAAEGQKNDGSGGFANSDPKLIVFMMDWFRAFCHLSESKFRGAIWLHEGLDENRAKLFWSKITKIPLKQFYKTYVVKRKDQTRKIRKNLHEYGVFSIRFNHTPTHRQIMGWISALFDAKIS